MIQVAVNDFVRRQIKGSGKSYSPSLSFEEIASHAEVQMEKNYFKEGYRDGVRIVAAGNEISEQFVCPFVKLTATNTLKANWVRRQPNEAPYIQIRAVNGPPVKAGKVELILYRHDVLAENNEHTTDSPWELISIHALPKGLDSLPMGPVTMMRNQLGLPGGTRAVYSSDEWANSVQFWQEYAALEDA